MRFLVCCLISLLATTSVWADANDTNVAAGVELSDSAFELEEDIALSPVIIDGETLFRVIGIPSTPAGERAEGIQAKIVALAEDPEVDVNAIRFEAFDEHTSFIYNEEVLFSLIEADAALEGIPLGILVTSVHERLQSAIITWRNDRSSVNLTENSGRFLVISAVTLLLVWLFHRLFVWLKGPALNRIKLKFGKIEDLANQVADTKQLWQLIESLINTVRIIVYIAITVAWVNFSLSLFPWTKHVVKQFYALILNPIRALGNGFVDALPDLFFLIVLTIVTRFLLGICKSFFNQVHSGLIRVDAISREVALTTYSILRIFIIAFALVIAYPYIPGSGSEGFKGLSIFFGVLLSMGSSSFISNMLAGYSLIYRRAYRIGDRVKINDVTGNITAMRALSTRIKTPKNEEVNFPNSVVLNSAIVNFSRLEKSGGLILHSEVGIGYDVPWRQVEAMLLQAAENTGGLLSEPKPFVLQKSLGDFTAIYQVNAFCRDAQQIESIYSRLHANIQDEFNRYGVQIMSPNYEHDPNTPKVVPPEKWYEAPAIPPPADKA
jgi:small-conductance mechanosensitive channel